MAECGCKIVRHDGKIIPVPKGYHISSLDCPLHAHAAALREALQRIIDADKEGDGGGIIQAIGETEKLLAATEAKHEHS